MRQIREGAATGSMPITPNLLFSKQRFATRPWTILLEQFNRERSEWRALLDCCDLSREFRIQRTYTAQTLTKRMVEHEKRHLDQLPSS